ncbi:MAG: hypothetical protein LBH74_05485 [Nitrososphaerota archaeon]|nr:hypothetical protein [Nitrososphaerota archaeon]
MHNERIFASQNTLGHSSDGLAEFQASNLDSTDCVFRQLFSPALDGVGVDLSLMSGAEAAFLATYAKMRRYFVEQYPKSRPDTATLGEAWTGDPQASSSIDVARAKYDPKFHLYFEALLKLLVVYDKLEVLQTQAVEYEKACLRLYGRLTYTWTQTKNRAELQGSFLGCLEDLFEIVEAYFKVCRKYGVPVFEEPYVFLSDEFKREVKLAGDVLRRTSGYSDFEIHLSILEGII